MTTLPDLSLHAGGLELTRRALALCGATPGMTLLDLGCGCASSVALAEELGLLAVGLDRRVTRSPGRPLTRPPFIQGAAERLPLSDGCVDIVLAECSLSLVADRATALAEIRRALRPGGALALSDVYLRSPERAPEVGALLRPVRRGPARSRAAICAELTTAGLIVERWEDHSAALRGLADAIGPRAVAAQWEPAPGADPFATALAVARARPGYFLLIARLAG